MKTSITIGTASLALAAMAASCATGAGKSARDEMVYLVGVAGGG